MARRLSTAGPVLTLRRSTDVLLVHHEQIGALLVMTDRHLGDQERKLSARRAPHAGYKPERICPFRVGRTPRMSRVPVVVVQTDGGKVKVSPMGITFFTGQDPAKTGHF